jgi:hypothetical protein
LGITYVYIVHFVFGEIKYTEILKATKKIIVMTKLEMNNNATILCPTEYLPLEDQVYGIELGLLEYVQKLSRCWVRKIPENNSQS